jgi:hypothetical protein
MVGTVLGPVKVGLVRRSPAAGGAMTASLDGPCARRPSLELGRDEGTAAARTKELMERRMKR